MTRAIRWRVGVTLAVLLATTPVPGRAQEGSVTAGVEEVRQLNQRGRSGDAERRARDLLVDAERRFGPESMETASVLDVLAESLQQAGKSREPDAVPSAERALRIKEARLGPDHKEVAVTLSALAGLLMNTGRYADAQTTLRRALQIRERTLGPDDPLTATTLGNLATVTSEFLGDTEVARPLLERARAVTEKAYGAEHVALGRVLFNSARNALRRDDVGNARAFLQRALGIFQKQYGLEHSLTGNTLASLAMAEQRLGNYAAAQERFQQGILVLEKSVGADHEWVANAVNDFGLLLWQLGDYARARTSYQRALDIWSAKKSGQAGAALNNLAILARRTGDYVEARGYYERSLAIKEASFGPHHVEVAVAVHNLGNLLGDIGDHAGARRLFERAIAIRVDKLGPSHSLVASSRYGLAGTLADAGRTTEAYREFTAALAIWRKNAPDSPDVAEGLRGLAGFFEKRRLLIRADAHYTEALALYERAYGADHIEVGSVLNSLAAVAVRRGQIMRARQLAERALPILRNALGTEAPQLAKALALQADLHLRSREWQPAIEKALQAETASREQFQLTARALSERQALDYSTLRTAGLDVAISALAANPRVEGAAGRIHDALIRARAMVLDELATRHRHTDQDPDLADARQRLAVARQRLANLLVRGAEGKPQQYRQLVDYARLEKDAAEEALASRSLRFRGERAGLAIGAADVRGQIPSGAALVTFVRYARKQPGLATVPAYAAFVVGSERGEPAFVSIGEAATIDALIRSWRDEVSRPARDGAAASESVYRRKAATLRAAVWDPLRPLLDRASRVFIVPDGALNVVAFAALPSGAGKYLAETGPLLHYLSAERDLIHPPLATADKRSLLVVGNPAFDAENAPGGVGGSLRGSSDDCVDFTRVRFARLPGTAIEADTVAQLWRRSTDSIGELDVRHLSESGAREAAFKREASGRSVLHLATHGFFLRDRCVTDAGTQRGVGGLAAPRTAPDRNPLLLSGLAMAGANRRRSAATEEDDGILTAEEIAALDLRAAELVVLSACDTGLGEIRAGEGVFGLRRALRVAGARTVVMSLWSVDDRAALAWMSTFYDRRLIGRSSIVEAVHAANAEQLAARRAKRHTTHPFYWAGFVADGDWR